MSSLPVTDRISSAERAYTLKAGAIMAVLLVVAGLIAWSMWRRGKVFGHENGAAWEYQPAKAANASHLASARNTASTGNAIAPSNTSSLPGPAAAHTPDLIGKPLKRQTPGMRLPLARPVPDSAPDTVAPRRHKRHRRDVLGLGKLWHWIRREHRKTPE